jgi:Uma2 family endonuclease
VHHYNRRFIEADDGRKFIYNWTNHLLTEFKVPHWPKTDMSTSATRTNYTPEDLLTMPDGDRYELVNGQLVEHTMSALASYIAGMIYWLLHGFCWASKLGWVFPEGATYQCFSDDPERVRKADVSFIRLERMTAEQASVKGHLRVFPDLAVEVISPNDLYYEVESKAEEWLSAGVQMVWIVNPRARNVAVRRSNGTTTVLHENDELTGEQVIPGFRCRVRDLFLLPTETTPVA